mgnify:CR=1 FL=1
MLLKRKCAAKEFAHRIEVEHLENISQKTKAFLKGKAKNFFQISEITPEEISTILDTSVRIEVKNLRSRILRSFEKEERVVHYSSNIARPVTRPTKEELRTLVALLLFENFLGNRREITSTKRAHLPGLYSEVKDQKAKIKMIPRYRKYSKIAS